MTSTGAAVAAADDGGFLFWVGRFRTAKCTGRRRSPPRPRRSRASSRAGRSTPIRNRTNSSTVGDLYKPSCARRRRTGVQFWINSIANARLTREQVRQHSWQRRVPGPRASRSSRGLPAVGADGKSVERNLAPADDGPTVQRPAAARPTSQRATSLRAPVRSLPSRRLETAHAGGCCVERAVPSPVNWMPGGAGAAQPHAWRQDQVADLIVRLAVVSRHATRTCRMWRATRRHRDPSLATSRSQQPHEDACASPR